jgi:hypothetical protein
MFSEMMDGVSATETNVAGVTVEITEPLMEADIAVIVLVPRDLLVASPPLEIVATAGADDVQVAELVRSCVLPSEYVPVAVNCCVVPSTMEGSTGVTASDTSAACPTLSSAEAVMTPEVAVIVTVPAPRPVDNPLAAIVATAPEDEPQLTAPVRSCVLPLV